jgi:tetratricopeptide (TPR) repeat protein
VAQVGLRNNLTAGLPVLAREVARQKPVNAEFYSVLGDGFLAAGNRPEAIKAYERAVQLNPKSASALRSLAAADASRAAQLLAKAIEVAPNDPITWYRLGLLEASAEKIRKAIALDPTLPEQSRGLAEVLLKTGQPAEARIALQEALRVDPYDDAAWNLQARVLVDQRELPEAVYSFEKAIRLNPREASYLYDYALALARMDRLDDAFTRVTAALAINPQLAPAHELLGGLFETQRRLPDAVREYGRALELQPTSRVHLRLGNVLAAQGDIARATQHLETAAKATDPAIAAKATEALSRLSR